MPSKFENKYLKHSFYWVDSIEIDALNLSLCVSLISNPEIQKIDGVLKFQEIIQYQGIYHEYEGVYYESKFDKDFIPSLLGIFSEKVSDGTKYTITTCTVEITLITTKEPEIQWKD